MPDSPQYTLASLHRSHRKLAGAAEAAWCVHIHILWTLLVTPLLVYNLSRAIVTGLQAGLWPFHFLGMLDSLCSDIVMHTVQQDWLPGKPSSHLKDFVQGAICEGRCILVAALQIDRQDSDALGISSIEKRLLKSYSTLWNNHFNHGIPYNAHHPYSMSQTQEDNKVKAWTMSLMA